MPFSYLQIIEVVVSIITGGLLWQIWNIRAALVSTSDKAAGAKQNAWENGQAIEELKVEVTRLREEHKDIQGNQARTDEKISKFAEDVGDKVTTIMRDHGEHEVGQAKIEAKLDELIRRTGHGIH